MQLNSNKAKKLLNWDAKLDIDETVRFITDWYKGYKNNKTKIYNISLNQIKDLKIELNDKNCYSCWWLWNKIIRIHKKIPKPMVKIKNKPILIHIMKHYANYGFKDFYIALGYKGNVIKNYFKKNKFSWNIKLVDTGINTMTGGRIKKLKKYLGNESFFATYGDGISDINLNKLLKFHKQNKKLVTLTAVRPPARFGAIKLSGNKVKFFKEKDKIDEGWINGAFL